MTKRRDLVRQIQAAARARSLTWDLLREGASHEVWRCGRTNVTIPRHREVSERTAFDIRQSLQGELGVGWWR